MSPEQTDFLYPFIEADERDSEGLLVDLAASAQGKADQSHRLKLATLDRCHEQIELIVDALAERFRAGGRLFVFGNGGSSTDAGTLAALFAQPPVGVALPARSLATDTAVLTALSNDVGFELVFSRQIIAHARRGDIAVGISTSGDSGNLIQAFAEAKRRGLLTVGLAGYHGGRMAASADVDHCLVVGSDSVHRIQEAQAVLGFELWAGVQQRLAEGGGNEVRR